MDLEARGRGGSGPEPARRRGLWEQLAVAGLGGDGDPRESPAELVRYHQLEIFAQGFPRLLLTFTLLYFLLSLATFALMLWVLVSFFQELRNVCDVPLQTWVAVGFSSTVYFGVHAAIFQCCCEGRSGHALPRFGKLHLFLVIIFDLSWLGMGLFWLFGSETCHLTSPRLYLAAKVYAIASIVENVLVCINMVGLYTIMSYMLQNGVLRTKDAAPQGTLESMQVVNFNPDSDVFKEQTECCICLAAFGSNTGQARLTSCGHVFHSRCLGNWLKVNHTCPLCRSSLIGRGAPGMPDAAEPAAAVIGARATSR